MILRIQDLSRLCEMSRVPSTDKLVKKTMLLDACSTRFSRYVNLSSFLTQIGKVTYSSFVLIGHKFPSPIASFVHRESAVTL